jgi:dTDP-4-amino-4,6-dideoxygalactose transaminase
MIPLFKVNMAQDAYLRVAEVLRSGYIGQGKVVEKFEDVLEKKFGRRPLTTSSCTHALDLAYHLAEIKPYTDSIVISTPMTCLATNMPLVHRRAKIVWADIDPLTGNIDPHSVERLLKYWDGYVEAVVIVDWAGRECDTAHLAELSARWDIPIIEDAAHVFHSKPCRHDYPDNWYTAYSFQAIKHLTCGDGGALIVPKAQYQRAKLLRWFGLDRTKGGMRSDQNVSEAGYKYHMNDINAAIGLANFSRANDSVMRARENASFYNDALSRTRKVTCPPPDEGSSWWMYVIRTPERERFIKFMAKRGIEVGAAHRRNDRSECMRQCEYDKDGKLPGVAAYDAEQCSIPVGWWLSVNDLHTIADAVLAWDKKVGK